MKVLVSLSASYYEVHLTRGDKEVTVYVPHGPETDQTKYYREFRDSVNRENRRHHEADRLMWIMKDGRALVKRMPKQDSTHLTYSDFRGAYF